MTYPIRVLQIVDNLSTMSGVSSMLMNLYRSIDRSKVQFDFLVSEKRNDSFEEEIISHGGRIIYIGNPLSLSSMMRANKNAKRFFKENAMNYKIVHLHSATICEFTIKHAKRYGIPNRIVHSHSTMTSPNAIKAFINKILILRLKQYCNYYWTCSTEAGYFLYGKGFCGKNEVCIIYNAVNTHKFMFSTEKRNEMRKNYGLEHSNVIMHISNFSPIKNHVFMLDVIEQCCKVNKIIKFVFIGDGPEKKKFSSEIKERGLDWACVFLGKINKVQDYLQAADLVILPSLKEGLPLTVVEAQASGLPCLVSDTITRDVKVTDVTYLPLEKREWAEYLSRFQKKTDEERRELSVIFSESQFNVENEANRVMAKYLDLWRKSE